MWHAVAPLRAARSAPHHLRAGPAVFRDAAGAEIRQPGGFATSRVVEREIQPEDAVQVGAPEIETGTHHADLVADAQAVAPAERVGISR